MEKQATNYDDVKQYRLDPEREQELVRTAGECVFCLGKQGRASARRHHGLRSRQRQDLDDGHARTRAHQGDRPRPAIVRGDVQQRHADGWRQNGDVQGPHRHSRRSQNQDVDVPHPRRRHGGCERRRQRVHCRSRSGDIRPLSGHAGTRGTGIHAGNVDSVRRRQDGAGHGGRVRANGGRGMQARNDEVFHGTRRRKSSNRHRRCDGSRRGRLTPHWRAKARA